MKHWRITKYNPEFRDESGRYRREDWTSFDDIGSAFSGTVLTMADYLQTEDRYVGAALHFLHEAGVRELIASEVELRRSDLTVAEGMPIHDYNAEELIRQILRCELWCKLECRPRFYLHFGYDYYMYIGNESDLPVSIQYASECGLFVEEFVSPYLRWD